MKTLYLECAMGAAGDMLTAALLELTGDRQAFIEKMNALGLPGVTVTAEESVRCGITGTHVSVTVNGAEEESADADCHPHEHEHGHESPHDHEHEHEHHHGHHHSSVPEIEALISGLPVSDRVKSDAKAVYALIADAESRVHGWPVSEIHFHEVGTLDAVADVVGVCLLMEALAPEQVIVSPVHTGSGHVSCAHGILPVPAPATALILQGIPTYGGRIKGELCTPTGAALLKHFASRFGDCPVMTVSAIGYGMGKKDFEQANCVRAFLGESEGERGYRFCHGPAVRCRREGCLHPAHRDEEEPSGRPAVRHLPDTGCGPARGNHDEAYHHAGRPASGPEPVCADAQGRDGGHSLRTGPG